MALEHLILSQEYPHYTLSECMKNEAYFRLLTEFCLDVAAGGGGKGTWGKLLTADGDAVVDRNDPNYDSGEVCSFLHFRNLVHMHPSAHNWLLKRRKI